MPGQHKCIIFFSLALAVVLSATITIAILAFSPIWPFFRLTTYRVIIPAFERKLCSLKWTLSPPPKGPNYTSSCSSKFLTEFRTGSADAVPESLILRNLHGFHNEIERSSDDHRKLQAKRHGDHQNMTSQESLARSHAATQFQPRIALIASLPQRTPLGYRRYANFLKPTVLEEASDSSNSMGPQFQCIPLKEAVESSPEVCGRLFEGSAPLVPPFSLGSGNISELRNHFEVSRNKTKSAKVKVNLFVVVGLSLANIHILDTEEGLVLFDTTEKPHNLERIMTLFNEMMTRNGCEVKPIRVAILSHFHTDHVGGLSYLEFYNDMVNGGKCVKVTPTAKILSQCPALSFSHHLTFKGISTQFLVSPQASFRRAMEQFGSSTFLHHRGDGDPEVVSSGIGSALVGWTRDPNAKNQESYRRQQSILNATSLLSAIEDLLGDGNRSLASAPKRRLQEEASDDGVSGLVDDIPDGGDKCTPSALRTKYAPVAYPTHTWNESLIRFTVAGTDLYIQLLPGETHDQINIFVPSLRTHFIADNFYSAFPNIYPLRGGVFRSPVTWISSLDTVIDVYTPEIDVLTTGHTLPVVGKRRIKKLLQRYRDAIQFIDDQTSRVLNTVNDVDSVASLVVSTFYSTFPKFHEDDYRDLDSSFEVAQVPVFDPLLPFYGNLEWAVKALVHHKMGWFQGSAVELASHQLTHANRARLLSALILAPVPNVTAIAKKAISRGHCQWALELLTILKIQSSETPAATPCAWNPFDLKDNPKSNSCTVSDTCTGEEPSIDCLRRDALFCLATHDISSSGRNWYLFETLEPWQLQLEERNHVLSAFAMRSAFIASLPDQGEIIKSFSTRFQPGLLPPEKEIYLLLTIDPSPPRVPDAAFLNRGGNNRTSSFTPMASVPLVPSLVFSWPTEGRKYSVRLRNSVVVVKPADEDLSEDPFDAEVSFTDEALRQAFLREDNPIRQFLAGDMKISAKTNRFKKFRELLDLLLAIEHQ